MTKKIGLLTFHNNTNYGSWLQTYALYKSVAEMGYDIEVINYFREVIPAEELVTLKGIRDLWNKYQWDSIALIKNIFRMQIQFQIDKRKYMKVSEKRYRRDNVKVLNSKYDVFLIGSDLVWDIRHAGNYTYLLDFADTDKVKISYAASYGYEQIPNEELNHFKKYLSGFQRITVRENNCKEELEKRLNLSSEHVCDPTMLIENSEWKNWVLENRRKRKYILIYMYDEKEKKLIKLAKRYARKHHCEVVQIGKRDGTCPYSVSEFLALFYYAEKVFTASYHGLVFSVYFEKNFAYCNRKPANRMKSISEVLGLGEYEISSPDFILEKNVDYSVIKPREEAFRKKSKLVLKEMMENAVRS